MLITKPVKGQEPVVPEGELSRVWLSSMMTWYASNRSNEIKNYAVKFGKKEGIIGLDGLPDKVFNLLTPKIVVSRLIARGFVPESQMPDEAERIASHIEGLKDSLSNLVESRKPAPKKSTVQYSTVKELPKKETLIEESQNVVSVLNSLDSWFDLVLESKHNNTRSPALILSKPSSLSLEEKVVITKSIAGFMNEYTSREIAFTEGYENLVPLQKTLKKELKRTLDIVMLWDTAAVVSEEKKPKAERKPRTVSPMAAAKKLVKLKEKVDSKLKYDPTGLKPSQIFKSKIAVFWNKKYSQLIIAEGQPDLAIEGATLSKDGNNIPVFVKRVKNIENIVQARKDDSVFRNILKDFLDARGKVSMKPSMRVSSEDLVIVKVFSSISAIDQKKLDTLRISLKPSE